MKRLMMLVCVAGAAGYAGFSLAPSARASRIEEKMLVHNVFFTLKDPTQANIDKLVENCKKYLINHEGVVFFGVGTRIKDLNRDVNDKEYDFGLHLVFKDKACHDKYQDAPDHLKFIEESKDLWSKVRVFDNNLLAHESKE